MSGKADQPAPEHNRFESVWESVLRDIEDRRVHGKSKYGTELQPFNGRNALQDAYEEALDLVVYLKQRLIEES